MPYEQAKPAASAASVALIALCLCVAALLPPLNESVLGSAPIVVLLGLAIAVSLVVHLIFVGMTARRLGRNPMPWVVLALLTLPVGSIVGLVMFEWFAHQQQQRQQGAGSSSGTA